MRRRGIGLTVVLASMPVILILAGVSYQITARLLRFEGRLKTQLQEETMAFDLVRRIQRDARAAGSASSRGSAETGWTLVFPHIEYQFMPDGTIRRQEKQEAGATQVTTLKRIKMGFALERPRLPEAQVQTRPAGSADQNASMVVWLTLTSPGATDRGPAIDRTCSMAALVGGEREP